jgi:hypothetical protein
VHRDKPNPTRLQHDQTHHDHHVGYPLAGIEVTLVAREPAR